MSFVVLLRAVNVGGVKLPMEQLRTLLQGLGLANVRTYLQSGNAVFHTADDGEPPQALATAIARRIERDIGPRVGVLVLPGEAMVDIAAANPFVRDASGTRVAAGGRPSGARPSGGTSSGARRSGGAPDENILHATFLFGSDGEADSEEASRAAYSAVYQAAFTRLALPAAEGEEVAFVGSPPLAAPVVYLKLPHGYGRTKLNNVFFERKLGTTATTRNWRTVVALAAMAGGSD